MSRVLHILIDAIESPWCLTGKRPSLQLFFNMGAHRDHRYSSTYAALTVPFSVHVSFLHCSVSCISYTNISCLEGVIALSLE